MNPDNSEANEGILDPRILLRRFVIDSTNSPSPNTTIPADNAASFPNKLSGIFDAPSKNG